MANLNVKGSVNITGSLTGDFNIIYGRKVDVMDQINDTGWLEIPGSPWIGSKTIGPGGLNDFGTPDEGRSYAKFRVVNNIVYLHILNKESKNIPIWIEGQTITGLQLGALPKPLWPSHHLRFLADPVDSSGYEVQVSVNANNGKLEAVCLGGSKIKNVMSLCASYPIDIQYGYDKLQILLESAYK